MNTTDAIYDVRHRFLAFYLPQFHPIPENDRWWGKGFTEWINVVKAHPRFDGHYQPHLPSELGFYDLRLPEARSAQAELAQTFGVDGFVYYHYWFSGKRLLHRPFDEVLASGQPEFPFCLCWANESWSRKWGPTYGSRPVAKGLRVLIRQSYSHYDDLRHIRWLATAFEDQRYLRVNNKPLFIVFRASSLPDPQKTTDTWRLEAQRLGIGDLYLCMIQAFPADWSEPAELGFDAAVEFQPESRRRVRVIREDGAAATENLFSYKRTVELSLAQTPPSYKRYPCVMPSWDNSARRSVEATIYVESTSDLYEQWVFGTMQQHPTNRSDENLIFINAWNEWAEGCHLEPDERWGRGYLEAHSRAIERFSMLIRASTIRRKTGHKPRQKFDCDIID